MIAFIDESYERTEEGDYLAVLGGLVIDEFRYRALESAVYQARFRLAEAIYARDALTEDELMSRVHRLEIKGEYVFKRKSMERIRDGIANPGAEAAVQILSQAVECRATVVSVVRRVPTMGAFFGEDERCTEPSVSLLRSISRYVKETAPEKPVILAFDTIHGGVNAPLSRRISNFLYRARESEAMRALVPVPFWIPSDSTAGSQVADLICHLRLLEHRSPPYPYLDLIRPHLDVIDSITWRGQK